jgi:RES domain-containing protein
VSGSAREAALVSGAEEAPAHRVRWRAAIRVIPSRFPTIDVFARVAPAGDFEALYEIESLTNPRLREEAGEIDVVRREDRVFYAGASYVMAPFAHVQPAGGRFNDGTFGALYAARERATAIAETSHHRTRFMLATREPPLELDMRVLELRVDARLHDIRGMQSDLPRIYDPDDYSASQRLGRRLRDARSWGIAFDSVRRAGGACVAAFRPRAIASCRQAEHLVYVWDGTRIASVYEKRFYRA